jgi:hypothetical protein
MERESSQFRQREQHEGTELNQNHHAATEFASVEEMLRFDASQTGVPTAIVERLHASIALDPPPKPSWWRKLQDWRR